MYDNLDLNDMDRSISGLRTLRIPDDQDIFWFRDDLHQPYPISPLGMTTIQKHHAWGYHVAAEETKLPRSKGGHVKILKGRVFLGFEELKDGAEIGKRASEFGKLLDDLRDHWDAYYNPWTASACAPARRLPTDSAGILPRPVDPARRPPDLLISRAVMTWPYRRRYNRRRSSA